MLVSASISGGFHIVQWQGKEAQETVEKEKIWENINFDKSCRKN